MDINVFLTQQAAQGGKGQSGRPVQGGGSGIFASGAAGHSFMDLIFARLTADIQSGEKSAKNESVALNKLAKSLSQDGKLINAQPNFDGDHQPLSAEQIIEAAFEAAIEADPSLLQKGDAVQGFSAKEIAALEKFAALIEAREKITAYLQNLLKGQAQNNEETRITLSTGELKQSPGRIQSEPEGAPALIATGISVEDLTKLIEDLAEGNEQGENFAIGLVKILPPESKKDIVFLPRGAVTTQSKHPAGDLATPQAGNTAANADPLSSKLNALTVGEDGASYEESDFEGLLRILEKAQVKKGAGASIGNDNANIQKAIKEIRQNVSAGLSTIQGPPPALTEMFASFSPNSIYPEGWDFATGSSHSLNMTGPAQLTSMIGHIQQAGMPHPATQMVASTIAKATTNGETRNVTIQLDPPDLGRVSVKLEFNKENNTVKALLVAEKPETHLMLQRDSQVLERALQEAGLDADNSSLEFQLSQDGNMFEQDQHSTGGNSGGGSDTGEGEEDGAMEIIETTMDWYVDPQTGVMRYDALV